MNASSDHSKVCNNNTLIIDLTSSVLPDLFAVIHFKMKKINESTTFIIKHDAPVFQSRRGGTLPPCPVVTKRTGEGRARGCPP